MKYTILFRKKGNSLGLVVDRFTVDAKSFAGAVETAVLKYGMAHDLTWHSIVANETGEQFLLSDIRRGVELPERR